MSIMKLLLLSINPAAIPAFLGTGITEITYLDDAASRLGDAPFVTAEREGLQRLGYALHRITAHDMTATEFGAILEKSHALYLSSGLADVLLASLRNNRKDQVLSEAAHAGLPIIGASAGSIILGNDIAPGLLMDGPTDGITLNPTTALGLVDTTIVPHADGKLPPYPPQKMQQVRAVLGQGPHVTYLNDDQALLVHDQKTHIITSA